MKFIDPAVLQDYIDNKWVSVQKHPTEDLYIYNYTQRTQFARQWDDVTMACRGLILNGEGEIVARPFPKFFNLEEHIEALKLPLPLEDFEVYDKLDGSLGILYHLSNGTPQIATRGSFVSDQAKKGTEILLKTLSKQPGFTIFSQDKTWLFEIIYPANRIVVNYGDTENLFLLACIETATGEEISLDVVGSIFPKVDRFDGITDVHKIKELAKENAEGVVIRYKSGLRLKVKYDEYVRLHRIVTGVNAKSIWEMLKDNKSIEELLDRVPDEFYKWVDKTIAHLKWEFSLVEDLAYKDLEKIKDLPTRKDQALALQESKFRGIVFKLLDKQPYEELIWKMIRPVAEKPFKEDIDA